MGEVKVQDVNLTMLSANLMSLYPINFQMLLMGRWRSRSASIEFHNKKVLGSNPSRSLFSIFIYYGNNLSQNSIKKIVNQWYGILS